MPQFKPILKQEGDLIRSEDWNKIQEQMLVDIQELENKLTNLKNYVDNMEESTTILNLESPIGKSYGLTDPTPGESSGYNEAIVGILNKQWLIEKGGTGEICRFSIVSKLESLDYWSGAENGNKKTLEIIFSYIDGSSAVISNVFIHDRRRLQTKGTDNPFIEYILSPNQCAWYRYQVINPNPEKEVLNVTFKNTIEGCIPRIGNALHYRSKIIPRKQLI